ncbi:MAG: glycosyltransferase family 2 protein [Novosphingobium sp.]
MAEVSIALASYNGARFLPQQLASLLAQTRLPDELVVGDDRSSDDTVALLEDFAARAPFPVRITVNAENLGPTRNFAETVLRCRGQVIFLCDQDDVWEPGKLAAVLDHRAANPGAWVITHDAALVDAEGTPLGLTMAGQIARSGDDPAQALVAGCCMAIDARLAALYRPCPRMGEHDAWLAHTADLLGLRSWLPVPLIQYRRHGGNVSQSFMSSARPASRWTRLVGRARKALAAPLRQSLQQAIDARTDRVAAIRLHRGVLEQAVPPARIDAVITAETARLERDRQRLAIALAPRCTAPGMIVRAAAQGVYVGKDGSLSLLRDVWAALRGRA